MAGSFRFGLQFANPANRDAMQAEARGAEDLGYSEIWTADHVGLPDPFLPLQVAADATRRLRVGPLVLNNEFHHPVLLARTAATIDRLTEGRLVLGLGTGYASEEHEATAIQLRAPGARVDRFTESIEVLRSLLDTGAAKFVGEHHQVDVDDLGVRPVQQRVPILIGGHGRRVVELAGSQGDIFQYTGMNMKPDGTIVPIGFRLDDLRTRSNWFEAAAGSRLPSIERSALVQRCVVAEDVSEALDEATSIADLSTDEINDCPFLLIGSVDQLVDKIGRLRDVLGISHYVVRDAEAFAPVVAQLAGT